jgi:hypothetical protein
MEFPDDIDKEFELIFISDNEDTDETKFSWNITEITKQKLKF